VFRSYPPRIRTRLHRLRELIFETAASTDGVGPITETLKWGEPAYLTEATGSGSTIRIGWKASAPEHYTMYFNCQTSLVDTFRTLFPELRFEGNRALVFAADAPPPDEDIAKCVELALTYHVWKRRRERTRAGGRR